MKTLPEVHDYNAYTNGCRCAVCRKAKADYMRARRKRARELANRIAESGGYHLVPGIKHGRHGYEEHGCRCQVCRDAMHAMKRSLPSYKTRWRRHR